MKAGGLVLCALGLGLSMSVAHADGTLPPQPYNYLHPPPALAGINRPPQSGVGIVSLQSGRSPAVFVFTRDGQAGISAPSGAVRAPAGTPSIRLEIRPVETPTRLPGSLSADGNAYRITATGLPGKGPIELTQRVELILRWPYPPHAVYEYRGGAWDEVCSSSHAIITSETFSCPIVALGTFIAVTPAPQHPILVAIVLGVITGAAALGIVFALVYFFR